ncbi:MAG TPA: translation factor GTPase family protein, partial [Thermomicrobiales bacterium]|nr:translation factor GTPase family protein [Thermomicrobiales bacterium]
MRTLNLGILAHVDAGKTSLTERILFETGVITDIGRVDHGTTQTDTLELERQRGITIKSAVASFQLDNLAVNLIDTPGHSDFIAEVGRALQVLDAVIVVISAVEGVQSQTRRLVQAIRTSGIPLLLFINKIDRAGARSDDLIAEIARGLDLCPLVLSGVSDIGTRSASVHPHDVTEPAFAKRVLDVLAEHNDDVIARYLSADAGLSRKALRRELARQVRNLEVTPVFFGSAITGAGVSHLLNELPRLLRAVRNRPGDDLSGVVFKIQRTPTGEKVGLARLFSGRLAVREHVTVHHTPDDRQADCYSARISGIERYRSGALQTVSEARAGDIVRVHGIPELRIGDVLGQVLPGTPAARFPPPTLESVIRPEDPADTGRMYAALEQLEEQDPLINVRRGTRDATISLQLYGEVQKEVIEATLGAEYGIPVLFEPSRPLCIERVTGTGEAGEEPGGANPFGVPISFRIEPGPQESGVAYHRELGIVPLGFYRQIEETVFATLEEGLLG